MEKRNTIFVDKYPEEYQAVRDKENQQKEDALKIFGSYLISITNICFKKCIDTERIQLSKNEKNCLESCQGKMHMLYNKTLMKIYQEENFNLKRSTDFGDKYDLQNFLNFLKKDKEI